jgi:alpha-D-ribose 1-methylphosphonate 5-triphosphate synthase subunit PhnL
MGTGTRKQTTHLHRMTSIGIDYINQQDFVIDTTKHINIEGMSGMGKSTLLVNLLAVIRKRSFSVIGRQGLCGLA